MLVIGIASAENVEGRPWRGLSHCIQVPPVTKDRHWLRALARQLAGYKGVDGRLDSLWTCLRSNQVFIFNSTDRPVDTDRDGQPVKIAPYSIWPNQTAAKR